MKTRKKIHRIVSIIMILIMLIPANVSFAATFTDVGTSHWAYNYIEDMAKLKFINGYPDKTFKPDNSINLLESLQLISKLIEVTESEKATIKTTYSNLMKELQIADWVTEAVGKSIYKGVISEAELRTAHKSGMLSWNTNKIPSRLTISIYLAKAMGLEAEAAKKTVVFLPYKDIKEINEKYHNLLYMLIETEVLNPKGTGSGDFEPNGRIKRDAMAKMMSVAYKYVENNKKQVDTTILKGEITRITPFGTNVFLVNILDRDKKDNAFYIEETTQIKLDDVSINMSKLYVGQNVEVTYEKGTTVLISINASSVEEEISGFIKGISTYTNMITVEYTSGRNTVSSEYQLDKNIVVYLDGTKSSIGALNKGDKVDLVVKDNIAFEIDASSKEDEVEGTISKIYKDNKTSTYFITIKDGKSEEEYEVDKDATVYRNGKRATVGDLRVLDDILAQLEYDIIVDIDAEVVEAEVEGRIVRIIDTLNEPISITINNIKTDKEETYILAKDVKIFIDGVSAYPSELKTGYFVEMVVGSNEILEIDADSKSAEYFIRGKIIGISTKYDEIDIDITSSNIPGVAYGDEITVKASTNIEVIIGRNTYKDIDKLVKGDDILAFGQYNGSTFVVNEITVR